MKNVSVWSRSRLEPLFLPGAGADPMWSEPESAPRPWTSGAGAAKKSGGSATLLDDAWHYLLRRRWIILLLYFSDMTKYNECAREWTRKYAM